MSIRIHVSVIMLRNQDRTSEEWGARNPKHFSTNETLKKNWGRCGHTWKLENVLYRPSVFGCFKACGGDHTLTVQVASLPGLALLLLVRLHSHSDCAYC